MVIIFSPHISFKNYAKINYLLQNPPNVIYLMQLYLSLSLQILLPCYFGSMLTVESMALSNYVYASNWVDQSVKFKTDLNIMQLRSMKPIIPTTYKGTLVIGLETFVAVRLSFCL